jgi:DNA-binding NarL/FixJ family response regulator
MASKQDRTGTGKGVMSRRAVQPGDPRPQPIRVLLADSDQLLAQSLASVLGGEPTFDVVGNLSDLKWMPDRVRQARPDVMVLGYPLVQSDGDRIIVSLLADLPELKILVLTPSLDEETLYTCVRAGAVGCITRDSPPEELMRSIQRAHAGEILFTTDVLVRLLRRRPDTTDLDVDEFAERLTRAQATVIEQSDSPRDVVRRWLTQAGAVLASDSATLLITAVGGRLADAVPIPVAVASDQANETLVDGLVAAVRNGSDERSCSVVLLVYQQPPDALGQLRIVRARLREGVIVIPIPLAAAERALVTPGAPAALLTEYADRYLPGVDLFDDRNAVADTMMFYGRGDLLERLASDLVRGQGAGLFGLRKSGKTSTMLQLGYRLREHPVVHVDLQRHGGATRFGAALLDDVLGQLRALLVQRDPRLVPEWPRFMPATPAGEVIGPFAERFDMLSERLQQAGYRAPIVCFLDEMERLLPAPADPREKAEEFNACFGTLRALSQGRRRLAMLVADVHPDSNRINRWPQESTGTNPLYSFFKEVFLAPFPEADTATMLNGLGQLMGWGFDEPTLRAIHAASGGHPFISRQLASLLCERLEPSDGDTVAWPAARRYLERPLHYSGVLKDYFGENVWADLEKRDAEGTLAVLRALAKHEGPGLTVVELEHAAHDRASPGQILDALLWLEAVGLVARDESAEADRYRLCVPLVASWLRLQFGVAAGSARPVG